MKVVVFDEENGHFPANVEFPIMDEIVYMKGNQIDKFYIEFLLADGTVSHYRVEVVGPLPNVTWHIYRVEWGNEFMWYERFSIKDSSSDRETLMTKNLPITQSWN